MTIERVREEVSPHNPWWTTGKDPSVLKGLERSDYKHHFDLVVESRKRLLLLSGRKGVGKTDTVHRLIDDLLEQDDIEPQEILYFPLDDPSYQLKETGSVITDVVEWYRKKVLGGKDKSYFVFLDDAHSVGEENWRKQVKEVLENENAHVVVTTVHGKLEEINEELGYEVPPPHMLPRKFYDYVSPRLPEEKTDRVKEDAHSARRSVLEALSEGEPELIAESFERLGERVNGGGGDREGDVGIDLCDSLKNYESHGADGIEDGRKRISDELELTIYKEMPRVRGFRGVVGAHSLCKHVAETPSEYVSYSDLETEIGVESRQLKRFVDALRDFYLMNPVYPFNYDVRRSFRLYLQNPKYAYTFSRTDERVSKRKVRETVVLDHLKRLSFFFHSRESAYTVTSGGKAGKGSDAFNFKQEVDFVFNFYPDMSPSGKTEMELPTHEVSIPTGGGGKQMEAASVPVNLEDERGGVGRMERVIQKVNEHSSGVCFEAGVVLKEGEDGVEVNDRVVEIPRWLFVLAC